MTLSMTKKMWGEPIVVYFKHFIVTGWTYTKIEKKIKFFTHTFISQIPKLKILPDHLPLFKYFFFFLLGCSILKQIRDIISFQSNISHYLRLYTESGFLRFFLFFFTLIWQSPFLKDIFLKDTDYSLKGGRWEGGSVQKEGFCPMNLISSDGLMIVLYVHFSSYRCVWKDKQVQVLILDIC